MDEFLHILSIAGSAVFMIFFFGLCIFVHELGHFLAAKWRGMHITAFSIGFRKMWGRTWNGVEYRIGYFPFGGYVEIPQLDSSDGAAAKDPSGKELPEASPLDRMIAVVAGPLFNFLFGFLLACVIWICGIPQDTAVFREITVDSITPGSPEYKAGLRKGDVIIRLNGKEINTTWNGVVREILTTAGEVTLTLRRPDGEKEIRYLPAVNREVMPDEEIAYPFFRPHLPISLYPEKGSPAEKGGIRKGDLALEVNGKKMLSLEEFESAIDDSDGKMISITLLRREKTLRCQVQPVPMQIEGRSGVHQIGIRYSPAEAEMKILALQKDYPAEKGGLRKDDVILKVNGQNANSANFGQFVTDCGGKPLLLTVKRNGKIFETTILPKFKRFHTIGVQYAYLSFPTPFRQFWDVMELTYKSMRGIVLYFTNRAGITERHSTIQPKHMSGPIGIGRILYLSVYRGSLIQGLSLVVLLSFSLGLMNLLPIPVLDGGHVVLALLEAVFKRKVSPKILQPITTVFVTLLIALMIFLTFYDTKRIITSFSPEKESPKKQLPPAEKQKDSPRNVPAK